MNEIYLTESQLQKTTQELEHFIHVKRPEVVERIKEAKSYGDLSENSEYDSAREEQAFVEAKIKELEAIVANAKIIAENINSDVVALGTTVRYLNLEKNEEFEYKIVGVGANPLDEEEPSISTATAIARGLLGKKVDDQFVIDIPKGQVEVKVLEIK